MSINRRQFLKIAGISSILGLGSAAATTGLLKGKPEAVQDIPSPEGLTAKRWGMVVDMSKFKTPKDYQRVINACHSIHNVPTFDNKKDEVKWIWTDDFEHTFPGQGNGFQGEEMNEKKFIVMCNHCAVPACVRVCPTKATFKRTDGIVMMDMHRCIGCRFCMAACPFGARSFNWRDPRPFIKETNPDYPTRTKGVVEKCTFCTERLEKGQLPACAEESAGGLVFGDLDNPDSEVRKLIAKHFTMRRKPELGTEPSIYYILGGGENA